MQIRNMQDQAEIAKQAAAIQQQQAQFAQQKQPLELQQIEAGIAAQQASAAHSSAATGLLGVQTQAAKSALEESQRKDQAVAAYQSEALKLAEDPTSWNATDLRKVAMKAAILDPQSFTGLKNLFSELPQAGNILSNAASEVVLSVNAGKPDVALNSINQYLTASQAALDKNPNDKAASAAVTFLQGAKTAIENDPAGAALSASNFLFNTDPKKFDATTNALKAAGEIGETQAKTKKALGESATGEVEIKDVFTKKLLKDSIDKAQQYSEKANNALSVLDKIDSGEVKLPSGFIGNAVQYVRNKIPLLANDITALKNDYIRIKNSEAIKFLPPGSASDKDVQFAKQGLTSENSNPEQFRKAVEAMARLNTLDATYQEAQAAWLSRNGNIGDAKREISVLGDIVPKGTGFREWWKKSASNLVSGQGGASAPTKTDQITGTPALVPAGGTPADVDAILKQFGVKK
jgi:hypothetical protein